MIRRVQWPLAALCAAMLLSGCGGSSGGGDAAARASTNPLATTAQRDLDALAIRIHESGSFEPIRSEAKLAYILARGQIPSQEALSRLDGAIDELVFSAIQKVVNGDPYRPQVYWVNAQPRSWFGLDVPGSRYSYDNPDNIYRIIPIDGGLKYVVRGQRFKPGPSDVTFSLNDRGQGDSSPKMLCRARLHVGKRHQGLEVSSRLLLMTEAEVKKTSAEVKLLKGPSALALLWNGLGVLQEEIELLESLFAATQGF